MTGAGRPDLGLGRVHILGIGGAGMSAIARVLLARGVRVSGSDAKDSRRLAALRALGASVQVGHDPAYVESGAVDTVVVSSAIADSNAEVRAAQARGVPVLSRAAALGALMRGHRPVAVSGTHGKTTTTSMVTVALQHCGADPSFVIGSELHESGANAHLGSGDIFVVEADESDGSFLHLSPVVGIVTNVEADHLDQYASLRDIEAAFDSFLAGVDGFAVVCVDDPGGRALAERAAASGVDVRTYGATPDADFRFETHHGGGRGRTFDVIHRGVRIARTALQVPGVHNVANATAALATGVGLGFAAPVLADGLAAFSGTKRRFEYRGTANGIRVFDDYAHHPTEVEATLRAAREVAAGGRVVVAFQAHRYTRTAAFAADFGRALGLADDVVVMEVYAAGESAIPGASGEAIASHIPSGTAVTFEPSWSAVPAVVVDRARPGDLLMTMGAGDVGMLVPDILSALRDRQRR
jgi:UDP-N-acetylmuramate--alanine ligase